jgi:hypothetical protein
MRAREAYTAAGALLALGLIVPGPPAHGATDPLVDAWAPRGMVVRVVSRGGALVGTVERLRGAPGATADSDMCPREVGDVIWRVRRTGTTTNAQGQPIHTYTGEVLPMRKPPARTPPSSPPTAPPSPPAQPSAPADRGGEPAKPKPPQPPPTPTAPPEPTAPSAPGDAAAEQARACATWHSASFTLFPEWGEGRLKVVDHLGEAEDDQIFWARPM